MHNHILRFHHDINSKKSNASVNNNFFNLFSTLSDKPFIGNNNTNNKILNSKDSSNLSQTINGVANPNNINFSNNNSNINQFFSEDLFIYQCVNCRLFFTSSSSFSHNCLVTFVDKQPPTYFSPIYLKFNLSKFFSNSNSNNFLNSSSNSSSGISSNSTLQAVNLNEISNENLEFNLNNKRVKLDVSHQFPANQAENV